MTARRWDGTAWVPFNELLSRFGDANIRPTIKHYQDGVFGLGWYPLKSIKRWTGTAWVDVYTARLPPPPPPPDPDPDTGITPPPPPPDPPPGPTEFEDDGTIIDPSDVPGNFGTGDGTVEQQRALLRRTTTALSAAVSRSERRVNAINVQRMRYDNIAGKIIITGTTVFPRSRVKSITAALANVVLHYLAGNSPKASESFDLSAAIVAARGIERTFSGVPALDTDRALLFSTLTTATAQGQTEASAIDRRSDSLDRLRRRFNNNRIVRFVSGDGFETYTYDAIPDD